MWPGYSLDASVVGDDGEICAAGTGDGVDRRQPDPDELPPDPYLITRGSTTSGLNAQNRPR
jgi:hypothetical protein